MIDKLQCTCIEAYKTRNMRDPNCCACSCDHNDLVEQLAKANQQLQAVCNHNALQQTEITRLRSEAATATNEAAQHKITADYAKRHLEQCEEALSAEQNKREEVEQQLAKANERVAELERKVESEKFKKEEFVRWVDRLIEEQKELREQRFRAFGDDEYLIFFDDGEDYPDSMVAPVVMSADKFRELYYAREQLRKEQASE